MKAHGDIESVNLSTGERRTRVVGDGESVLISSRGHIDDARLGPRRDVSPGDTAAAAEEIENIVLHAQKILNGVKAMHYRNGREAKNGDKIVKLEAGRVVSFGVLHSATPGNDHCNGSISVIQAHNDYACMCDCLHVDDLAEILKEKGLDKRPAGK